MAGTLIRIDPSRPFPPSEGGGVREQPRMRPGREGALGGGAGSWGTPPSLEPVGPPGGGGLPRRGAGPAEAPPSLSPTQADRNPGMSPNPPRNLGLGAGPSGLHGFRRGPSRPGERVRPGRASPPRTGFHGPLFRGFLESFEDPPFFSSYVQFADSWSLGQDTGRGPPPRGRLPHPPRLRYFSGGG